MDDELVRYSRAGDVFHYRWAARRCLRMIRPKSRLRSIVIEGSAERKLAGEYVIDITEYSQLEEGNSQEIAYFQLKHTTTRADQPFKLGELRETIIGFAQRYSEHFCSKHTNSVLSKVTFSIITNRPIDSNFKQNILAISQGTPADKRFKSTLKGYTQLSDNHLRAFCSSLELADSEGNYNDQRYALHIEIAHLLAGKVDNPQIDSITSLIQEKALPDSGGVILPEDIFRRFGVTSERDLFPAPPEFETLDNAIPRQQFSELLTSILNASTPIIIHAAGGVGKSVFARQITHSLPVGSFGVVYDCFGSGKYRNRSEPRHRYRDALVQIVNELAYEGLCDPLIVQNASEDDILRKFIARISVAAQSLKQVNDSAILAILVDAADNAEMAAVEFSEPCFVHELLRESLPDGCRLVALCRTERIHLLQPSRTIPQLELMPFSTEETLIHLKRHFPNVSDTDGLEFYRLTNNGNPRVQANALNAGYETVMQLLGSLGPSGTTMEDQIKSQLDHSLSSLKDTYSTNYQRRIDAICQGLANLPPLIPISVLAQAADVDESAVRSFISDLGRPLWLSDTLVQFRDEPTETWFRENFSANPTQIAVYIERLKPLASRSSYVAEALPSMLLQAERYKELIELTLSDELLPHNNPIDARNVRVYRLQFAFKAALRSKQFLDATKLALRAGEEVAGNKRQLELLKKNVDLIAPLQSAQHVQELAYRRILSGSWNGSENVYSAALLSTVEDCKGEARGYLRAADNWLHIYFEERKKNKDKHYQDKLKDEDIVEFAYAYFNLFGIPEFVEFITRWRPPQVIYRITAFLIRRLVDAGNFDAINEILVNSIRNPYMVIAIAHELLEVGRFPDPALLQHCLMLLTWSRTRIPKPAHSYQDTTASAIISFLEACAAGNLPNNQILRVIRYYFPKQASHSVLSDYQANERAVYLRAIALMCVLTGNFEPNINDLVPQKSNPKEKNYRDEQEIQQYKVIIGRLLPWYILRARMLCGNGSNLVDVTNEVQQQSRQVDAPYGRASSFIPLEISGVCIDILIFGKNIDSKQITQFFDEQLKDNPKIWVNDRIKATRSAYRLEHLSAIKRVCEQSVYHVVISSSEESPETRADWYIALARAVLHSNQDDAATYFDHAIEAISKFGDEIVPRWEAVAALANKGANGGHASQEIAYRFIRCAELVGVNVAREKYFDREGAIRICTKLSPVSAAAALSRWRDRNIGWFAHLLPSLAQEMVHSSVISPIAGWSLSAFFDGADLANFASLCIKEETNEGYRQHILDSVVRDLRFNEAIVKDWHKLKGIAKKHSLNSNDIDAILAFYAENPPNQSKDAIYQNQRIHDENESAVDWPQIFSSLDLMTSRGISQAINRFNNAATPFRNHDIFWQEVFKRVDDNKVNAFLQTLIDIDDSDIYNIRVAFSRIPDHWRQMVSVKRNWSRYIELIGRRFATKLSNKYSLEYFLDSLHCEENIRPIIYRGIIEGLSTQSDLVDAEIFFNFVEVGSNYLSPQQALELLDFGLARFETHIDEDFGDGCWSAQLETPTDAVTAVSGLIWSALGSPRSAIRWQAAHCVRRLANTGCEREIGALIQWMEHDKVDSFGSNKFPFYNLHARLYLLIALARIAINNSKLLKQYHSLFAHYALSGIQHVLIQKFAADIALRIEELYHNTYSKDIVDQLHQTGVSQLPIKEMDRYGDKLVSYWHFQGEVDTSLEFYHGYDFDSYWFEPLGNVFGISGKQVEELATEVVINQWKINNDGRFYSDPRSRLWESSHNERETWHSHGSYPRTDDYSFYLSYHAMFVVAAKLLQKMPVVHSKDWAEDEWSEWLNRHLLTRRDGLWLADRRDPAPLGTPKWLQEQNTKSWRSDVTPDDFLDGLLFEHKGETWLNVSGGWVEGDREREENFYISSALVLPAAAQALLNALTTCPDPYDFKLPDYQEEHMEFETYPFELKGWIWCEDTYNRLDEFDPHGCQIGFPPYQVGKSIVDTLRLSPDSELREWFLPDKDRSSLLCTIWSTNKPWPDEDPLRRGKRLSASLKFLKRLCSSIGRELIFKVQIERRLKYKSYMRNENESEHTPNHCKIYILTRDGILRDAGTYYQVRENPS